MPDHDGEEPIPLDQYLELVDSGRIVPDRQRPGKRRRQRSRPRRDFEALLLSQIQEAGLPPPRREYKFHARRKWRLDMAWVEQLVCCEVDGGTFGRTVACHRCGATVKERLQNGKLMTVRLGGRHNTGSGYEKDAEKLNEAACYGYSVLRVTPKMIEDGRAIAWLERLLAEGL